MLTRWADDAAIDADPAQRNGSSVTGHGCSTLLGALIAATSIALPWLCASRSGKGHGKSGHPMVRPRRASLVRTRGRLELRARAVTAGRLGGPPNVARGGQLSPERSAKMVTGAVVGPFWEMRRFVDRTNMRASRRHARCLLPVLAKLVHVEAAVRVQPVPRASRSRARGRPANPARCRPRWVRDPRHPRP
jgi:hypothetical protein